MPNATVGAIILDPDKCIDTVLLTLRNVSPFKGQWCLPGGHIDPFESAHDAVLREVKEETGLHFEGCFFGWYDEIFQDIGVHNLVLSFAGHAFGTMSRQEAEVRDIRWFPLHEAMCLPLAFVHNRILKDFAARGVACPNQEEKQNTTGENLYCHDPHQRNRRLGTPVFAFCKK